MKAAQNFATKFSTLAATMALAGCLSSGGGSESNFAGDPGDPGPSNNAPSISGNPPSSATVGQSYTFTPQASDADGDPLTFSIQNNPSWANFSAATGALTGVPTLGDIGSYSNIQISVSDGKESSAMANFSVEVAQTPPTNSAPTISGNPPTSVASGQSYFFAPQATDPDGDSLTFSIQNPPSWASFDSDNGRLSGVPSIADIGDYTNIQISVSDGQLSTSLPSFNVEVTLTAPSNSPPTISGNPPSTVTVDESYAFTPQASDPDGDALTFSIQNTPSWASFDTATGSLTGVPAIGDIGLYTNIQISVSDGQLSTSLPSFNVEVTQVSSGSTSLSWTPPTLNEDGTTLTNLDGYNIYYGTSSGTYTEVILIDNPSVTTHLVENLTPGTYYFAAKSFNTADEESQQFSGELVRIVN